MTEMMDWELRHDQICGAPTIVAMNRRGYRWGHTQSEIGFHGGRVKVQRPRVRDHAWQGGLWRAGRCCHRRHRACCYEWALNLMVLNVSTRKYHRRGPSARGRPGESAWRRHLEVGRFPPLCGPVTQSKMKAIATRLATSRSSTSAGHPDRRSECRRPCLGGGDRRRWQLATSMSWPWSRGRRRTLHSRPGLARQSHGSPGGSIRRFVRLFIVDGAKALSKADPQHLRCGRFRHPPLARSTRAVTSSSRLPLHRRLRASRRRSVRPGTRTTQTRPIGCCATWPGVWSMRNRASRRSILEGLDEILTVIRLGAALELLYGARSPGANIVENALAHACRQVTRNVFRWRHAEMALRWTAVLRPAGGPENLPSQASRPMRQLPILRNALQELPT